jgi:diguanylate cyclase
MVLAQSESNGAFIYAERTRQLVECAKFPELGDDFQVTVSLGVATYQINEDISQTLSRADEALYRAKHAGRNRVEVSGS